MQGKVFIVCGERGSGKTSWMRQLVQKSKLPYYVYDFHGDWNVQLTSMEDFVAACNKAKNCIFVYEDATSYISTGSVKQTFRRALARSRGQGVTILLVFHSLRLIPLDLFEMANYLVLFRTKDQFERIEKRFEDFPKIIDAARFLRDAPQYSSRIISL
jgi:hypothetical protein